MKSNFSIYKLGILFLLFQSTLFAQGQEEKKKVSLRVDLISMGETVPNLYLGKRKAKSVNALAFRYDKTIKYNGDQIIQISQGSTAVANDEDLSDEDKEHASRPLTVKDLPNVEPGKADKYLRTILKLREKNPDLVAIAVAPAGSRHITVLLTPAANKTFRTLVLNDDPSKMPYGKMRIHNFCKHPIGMKFSDSKAAIIKPGKIYQVAPNKRRLVNYLLSYPKGKKWKIQESNMIRVTADQQVRMIILNSKSSFFQSSSGGRGGHLQIATLVRDKSVKPPKPAAESPSP